jgi:hypothetical protein
MSAEPPLHQFEIILFNSKKLTIMKRIAFTLGLLFALQFALFAQDDQEVVVFNAHLLDIFNLNVDGIDQEITFAIADDYNLGVTEAGGIVPGFTLISVEASGNWWLSINAPDFTPYDGPNGAGTGTIPINNLGVWCEATGDHDFADEVTCAHQSDAFALGLENEPAAPELIGNGSGNAGDISDNSFTLHWLMGTRQGSMNLTTTMFDQMSAGVFGPGDFTTTATLTLTEIP